MLNSFHARCTQDVRQVHTHSAQGLRNSPPFLQRRNARKYTLFNETSFPFVFPKNLIFTMRITVFFRVDRRAIPPRHTVYPTPVSCNKMQRPNLATKPVLAKRNLGLTVNTHKNERKPWERRLQQANAGHDPYWNPYRNPYRTKRPLQHQYL